MQDAAAISNELLKFDLLLVKRDVDTDSVIARDLLPNYKYESFYKFLQYLNTPEMQNAGVEYYIRPHDKTKALKSLPPDIFENGKIFKVGLYPNPENNKMGKGIILSYLLTETKKEKTKEEPNLKEVEMDEEDLPYPFKQVYWWIQL